jgi:hypothetical protein
MFSMTAVSQGTWRAVRIPRSGIDRRFSRLTRNYAGKEEGDLLLIAGKTHKPGIRVTDLRLSRHGTVKSTVG